AVDVGYGQLSWSLRTDPRVTVMERANVRDLTSSMLVYVPDLLVADLSFISLRLVLPALAELAATGATFVVLVKPQFEAGRARGRRRRRPRGRRRWRRNLPSGRLRRGADGLAGPRRQGRPPRVPHRGGAGRCGAADPRGARGYGDDRGTAGRSGRARRRRSVPATVGDERDHGGE